MIDPLQPYHTEEAIQADVKAFKEHMDNVVRCTMLRSEPCVREHFELSSYDARVLYGDDPAGWPEGFQWDTHRADTMWRCEQHARTLDADKTKWVHYPDREEPFNV